MVAAYVTGGGAVMANGRKSPLLILLHELAEGLQSTGAYIGAARRMKERDASVASPVDDFIGKAAEELCRIETAFHRLRGPSIPA